MIIDKLLFPLPVFSPDDEAAGGGDTSTDTKVDGDVSGDDKTGAAETGDDKTGDDKSFLGDDKAGGDDTKPQPVDKWPADWRDEWAGDDKDFRKLLDRYASPGEYAKAGRQAQIKLSKGGAKFAADDPMPDPEKDPDAAKAWREERGVPEDPTGYKIPESVAALVKDEDKPRLGKFTEAMHASGVPSKYAEAAMEFYFKEEAEGFEAIAVADKGDKAEIEDHLREEWGPDYRANVEVTKRFVDEFMPGFTEARHPDGMLLGSKPEIMKALNRMALNEYGDVTFAGRESADKTVARKAELEKMIQEDPDRYYSKPEYSAELQSIIEAEQRAASRKTT